jgi:precorrin-6B methylase 1
VVAQFGRESCLVIPGVSSVQVAFARLGLDWADARIISAHKQNPEPAIEETLRDENKLAILAGRDAALVWISNLLRKLGTGYGIFVCENLTLDNERIRKVAAEELPLLRAGSSTVVLIIRDSAWE